MPILGICTFPFRQHRTTVEDVMSETIKVFVACAIGAFIGTVVSLEVNRFFWWIGLIIGGFAGYISYEFKKVLTAVLTAWRKARGWQPNKEWWRSYVRETNNFAHFFTIGMTGGIFATTMFEPKMVQDGGWFAFSIIATSFPAGFLFGLVAVFGESDRLSTRFNFFRFYFWLLPKWTLKGGWWLLKGGWWLLKGSPSILAAVFWAVIIGAIVATKFTARFGKLLFREIHSDLRMLCGLDAAIGTVIGYFAGSAIIGALAGGLWGALNFEILSIRVLKLVSAEHSLLRRF